MDDLSVRKYLFGGETRQAVYKSLDATTLRNRSIAQNIANIQSPGYQRKEVKFEDELRRALKIKLSGAKTDKTHLDLGKEAAFKKIKPTVHQPYDPANASGANNVDIDIESAKLAENHILYNFDVKVAGFDKLKKAITGRQ